MKKHQDWNENTKNEEQPCTDVRRRHGFHPRRKFSSQREHFRHHPEKWRSNRRAILFFGLLFSLITILVISGVVLLVLQVINLPEQSPMTGNPKRWIPFLIFLLIMGALFVTGRFSRRKFSNPLEKILNAADRVAEGDLTTRIEDVGHGPFQRFETSFNHMVEELERSDQLRRDQTADIAHELNTPIHIIRGYLEGISDGVYEADEEMIALLMEETSLLTRLVDDLRLLSLAEAGRLPIHPERVNLKEVLEDIGVSFMGHAAEEQINFSVNAPEVGFIQADPSHIYRIINNLVSNALAYTPAGETVTLSLSIEADEAVLVVADTGQGLTEEDVQHVFDRFWRKEKSRKRKDGGGYGLGLSIVQQLVIANGGQISLESEWGLGTTFTLSFQVTE